MRARLLIVSVVFAAAVGVAHTQPPPLPAAPPPFPTDPPQVPAPPPLISADPRLPPSVAEKSLEKMLDQLEGLRTKKAELERQEQELMKDIRKLLDKQDERVRRLGVVSAPPVVPGPPVPAPPLVVPAGSGLPSYPLPKKN